MTHRTWTQIAAALAAALIFGPASGAEPPDDVQLAAIQPEPPAQTTRPSLCGPGGVGCTWERVIGTPQDEKVYGVVPHSSGGFVIVGNSRPLNGRNYDAWMIRLSADGTVEDERRFGGLGADQFYDVARGADGGLLAVGHTRSSGQGESDVWLLSTSENGAQRWERTLGGPDNDRARAVAAVPGGGYAVAGFTASSGAGERDAWVVRVADDGMVLWDRTYGGPGDDGIFDLAALPDGGLVLAGQSWAGDAAGYDIWLARLSPDGAVLWETRLDHDRFEAATGLAVLPEGGFAVVGTVGTRGTLSDDLWIARLTAEGEVVWEGRHGGTGRDTPWGLDVAADGTLLVAAVTWTDDAGAGDAWVLSFSDAGAVRWERRFGGRYWDKPTALVALPDGMLVVGHTSSKGAGFEDGWILRLDQDGRL